MKTDDGQKDYKRRTKYIEKDFQRSFILKFCFIALGAMVLASAVLYWMSRDTVTATYRLSHLTLESTADAIMPALIGTNVAVIAALIAMTIFVALYISFKIGGPLYRFSLELNNIGQGRLKDRIFLRKGDQLEQLAASINDMTDSLERKVRQIQRRAAQLKEKSQQREWDRDEIRKEILDLHEAVHTLFDRPA